MELYLDEFACNDPINGVNLLDPIEGLAGLPGIRTSQGVNAGQDGGWTSKQLFDARFISFPMYISGPAQDVETKRREFAAVLRRKNLTLRVVTYGGNEYMTKVVVLDAPAPITRLMNRVDYKINLKADDPIMYDNGADDDLLATVGKTVQGGFEIPFEIPLEIEAGSGPMAVSNLGNETVYPLIKIKTKATNPQLINITTGQMVKVEINTTDVDELVINMHPLAKTVTFNGLNVYGLLSAGSAFWGLSPGNNLIELITDVPSEETEAELYYRSGYIGI